MQHKNYSLTAYADTGFPKFMEGYRTLQHVRRTAHDLINDGYREIEIKLENTNQIGYFGAIRELIETIRA